MIGPIITGIISLGGTWLENKRKRSEAMAEKETELVKQAGSWEEIHAKGSMASWKDEYWTVIFSIPLILVFFPNMVDTVMEGFKALEQTPEWYRYLVGVLVLASVGIRKLEKFIGK